MTPAISEQKSVKNKKCIVFVWNPKIFIFFEIIFFLVRNDLITIIKFY